LARVLITGANGFIGANIVRAALKMDYEVKAFVRKTSNLKTIKNLPIEFAYGDLRNIKAVSKAMQNCNYIIHTGAIYIFSPMWFYEDPKKIKAIYDVNVWATNTLMREAMKQNVEKIIYTSSESAIVMPLDGSLGDERLFAAKEELPGHYKRSKYLGELIALKWNRKGLPTCSILPTVPIGPYDIKPTPTGRIIMDFMNGKMPGYVDTKMNIVSVKDVALAHVLAIEKGKSGERYIAGNKNISFRDFLRLIADVSGKKAPNLAIPKILAKFFACLDEFYSCKIKGTDPKTPLESVAAAKYRIFNCSKSWNELKMPRTNLRIAIREQIDWFYNNNYINIK
jgi:dihydroflavonol-4-reductase